MPYNLIDLFGCKQLCIFCGLFLNKISCCNITDLRFMSSSPSKLIHKSAPLRCFEVSLLSSTKHFFQKFFARIPTAEDSPLSCSFCYITTIVQNII